MRQIRRTPSNTKAILLIFIGLATGAWYAYNIATGTVVANYEPNIVLETLFTLTMIYTLIWTIRKQRQAQSPVK